MLPITKNAVYDQNQIFYKTEYQKILTHFSSYQKAKNDILKSPSGTIYIKIILLVIAIIILIFFGEFISDNLKYALLLGLGLVNIITGLFDNHQIQKLEKIDLLKLNYETLLVCPKCRSKLINQSYTYWKEKQSCNNHKCDVNFYP